MANARGGNRQLKEHLQNSASQQGGSAVAHSIKSILNSDSVKQRFEQILKNRASQYMSSIVNLVNSDPKLMECEPMSVIASCVIAATLDLPIEKNLGYAWVVPYFDGKNKRMMATFQMGYKGYIQLALRTSKYRAMNAIAIHEGELVSWNPLTEELVIDFTKKESDAVVGYAGHFELVNGFRKTVFWTKEQIEAHRQKFSKSGFGWSNDYDAMGLKTVIRNMLSKWGILSVEMQQAYVEDEKEAPETPNMDMGIIIDTTPISDEEVTSDVDAAKAETAATVEPGTISDDEQPTDAQLGI